MVASDNQLVAACRAVPVSIAVALMSFEVAIKYLRHGRELALSYTVRLHVSTEKAMEVCNGEKIFLIL